MVGEHQGRFERKLSVAHIEKVLEKRTTVRHRERPQAVKQDGVQDDGVIQSSVLVQTSSEWPSTSITMML